MGIALVAALVAGGCGGGDGEDQGSVGVVHSFVDEYRAGDYAAACDRIASNTASFELPDLAGAEFGSTAPCSTLLAQIAERGDSPLDDADVDEVTSLDESDVADSSTIETPAGTWTLESASDEPGGWVITGLPD